MENTTTKKKTGIIVARLQTSHLHDGHHRLISYVTERNYRVIIFLGTTDTKLTVNNPLTFEARDLMLKSYYPYIDVYPIKDQKSDKSWSENLDAMIEEYCPNEDVVLYGDRNSFLSSYSGKNRTEKTNIKLEGISATNIREGISKYPAYNDEKFRVGLIWASANRYPVSYQTVDVAVMDFDNERILLGRKKNEAKYRFIGGFVDPTDNSLESAAKREVMEECNMIETDDYAYLGSYRIDDWRYRNTQDKILTAFFVCRYIFGHPEPKDDIEELRWFNIIDLSVDDIEEEHQALYNVLMEKEDKK